MAKAFSRLRTIKMQAIAEALRLDAEGLPAGATCPECGTPLRVEHLDEIGSTWVTCDKGCTSAHFRRTPGPAGGRRRAGTDAPGG